MFKNWKLCQGLSNSRQTLHCLSLGDNLPLSFIELEEIVVHPVLPEFDIFKMTRRNRVLGDKAECYE